MPRPVDPHGTGRSRGRSPRGHGRVHQAGVALIVVLWVLALLGIIAATYSAGVRTETTLARNMLESARAHALMEAGVDLAVMKLLEVHADGTDSEAWRTDGTVYETAFDGAQLRIAIVDEAGKIDINEAPRQLLDSLLRRVQVPDDERAALVDAILDWRDRDQDRRPRGAEDDDYAAAGLPYGAADAPFASVEELRLVLGMQPAWYQVMEPAITVYSGSGGINPEVAPGPVLHALPDIDGAQVDEYLQLRQVDGAQAAPLSRTLLGNSPYLVVNVGRTFTLSVEAETASGAIASVDAVVRLNRPGNASPYQVLVWREPGRSPGKWP